MPRPQFELWGETLREIGILIVVFVPLETLLRPGPVRWAYPLVFFAFGAILTVVGVRLESR